MPSNHTVGKKTKPGEQMGKKSLKQKKKFVGVCSAPKDLWKDLYSYSTSGGGLTMRAFYHCFHCILKEKWNGCKQSL